MAPPAADPAARPAAPEALSRRRLLSVAAGAMAGLGVIAWAAPRSRSSDDPFTLGVASGDPGADGFVLWTRLLPDRLEPGALRGDTSVEWEVFADDGLRHRIAGGVAAARAADAHAVHVEVGGLAPDRWYWYRFRANGHVSPVGRARTFPPPGSPASRFRLASASCQMYEHGYFTAYRHMAADDLDLVVHLGDYIYEYAPGGFPSNSPSVRHHDGPEAIDLAGYRNRHALYRSDPDLQAAHAALPFAVTWDDHEVANNHAGPAPVGAADRRAFAVRRRHAYQAYWEHMPLRRASRPRHGNMALYRRLAFGDLVSLSMLDTRQYRSDQACGDGSHAVPCGAWASPERTMTGKRQERWLRDGLGMSRSRWNVLGQQVFMAQRATESDGAKRVSMDAWDGYPAARERLFRHVTDRRVENLVVLTGDVHRHWAADLKADFDDPSSPVLGAEMVCSSITSGGDGSDAREEGLRNANPHLRYCASRRGYLRCDVDRSRWRSDFLTMPYVSRPGAPIAVDASFVVEAGRPGLHPA